MALRHLLKVDRSFIGRPGGEPADAAITAAVCGLGRARPRRRPEGVSTRRSASALLSLDCGRAGYWISRPIEADGFRPAMTTREARLH
ncbi:MAG TPA: hypothetical protein VK923_15220 [Euzebyales bacterium]|nr:hypothetical protein [Euzebyales bacterium]